MNIPLTKPSSAAESVATEPLVSIIIPCFNAEAFVGEAIESAIGQTYPNVETIVIDDGSTDGSLDVIRSFGDRIHWETGPNRGGCSARNRGIELAKGKLIQLLDADDVLFAQKLERQLPVVIENPDQIVYCDHVVELVDEKAAPRLCSTLGRQDDPVILVLEHRNMTTLAPIHRGEWLAGVGGFRAGLRACQEFDLHLRLAAAGKRFLRLPEVLFMVRRRPDSVSSKTGRTLAALLQFLPEIVSDLQSRGALTPDRRAAFAFYAAWAARLCFREDERKAARELFEFAEALDRIAAERAFGPTARVAKQMIGTSGVEFIGKIRRLVATRLGATG
jgi:glycosyltransferase involved in cell wall biosynthesis